MKAWNTLRKAGTPALLEDEYNAFYRAYVDVDVRISLYIEEHVWPNRQKWAKCYTDKFLHFGNTSTSRSEGGHHQVKQELHFSTGKQACRSSINDADAEQPT